MDSGFLGNKVSVVRKIALRANFADCTERVLR